VRHERERGALGFIEVPHQRKHFVGSMRGRASRGAGYS
jgi:hypothetical protein